jgi:hypothetical protein
VGATVGSGGLPFSSGVSARDSVFVAGSCAVESWFALIMQASQITASQRNVVQQKQRREIDFESMRMIFMAVTYCESRPTSIREVGGGCERPAAGGPAKQG